MDLPRSVTRKSEKDLEHVRRYLLQLTAAHICPRITTTFSKMMSPSRTIQGKVDRSDPKAICFYSSVVQH